MIKTGASNNVLDILSTAENVKIKKRFGKKVGDMHAEVLIETPPSSMEKDKIVQFYPGAVLLINILISYSDNQKFYVCGIAAASGTPLYNVYHTSVRAYYNKLVEDVLVPKIREFIDMESEITGRIDDPLYETYDKDRDLLKDGFNAERFAKLFLTSPTSSYLHLNNRCYLVAAIAIESAIKPYKKVLDMA